MIDHWYLGPSNCFKTKIFKLCIAHNYNCKTEGAGKMSETFWLVQLWLPSHASLNGATVLKAVLQDTGLLV